MMLSYCGEADITTDQVTGVDTRTVDYCEHRAWVQVPFLSSYMVLMAHSQALVLSGLLILVVAATVKHFLIGYSTDDTQFRRYYDQCLDEFDGDILRCCFNPQQGESGEEFKQHVERPTKQTTAALIELEPRSAHVAIA